METVIVAKIDRDYINDGSDGIDSRVGVTFHQHGNLASPNTPTVRFRCKDDDGEIYYGGWLKNDDECVVQSEVLRWTEVDAGCTTIEVSIGGEWKQEIG